MNNFFSQTCFTTENILRRIDTIREQIIYLKSKYPLDIEANKFFGWCLKEFDVVVHLIQLNPRYKWVELQKEMDRLYKLDKNITGYNILIDFKKTSDPCRALITKNIEKK